MTDQSRFTGEFMIVKDKGLAHDDTKIAPQGIVKPFYHIETNNLLITFFQHHPDGHPGLMASLCEAQGIPYKVVPLYEDQQPILDSQTTHLIMLGGDQEMDDLAKVRATYPHFDWELEAVRGFMAAHKPVLGICLGAEIIAVALGIPVQKKGREYGWGEVRILEPRVLMGLPETVHVFEYHDDSFQLPETARLLITSDRVKNQCFTFDNVIGTQFHPEVTPQMIDVWTDDPALRRGSLRYASEGARVAAAIFNHFIMLGIPSTIFNEGRQVWIINPGGEEWKGASEQTAHGGK